MLNSSKGCFCGVIAQVAPAITMARQYFKPLYNVLICNINNRITKIALNLPLLLLTMPLPQSPIPTNKPGVEPKRPSRPVNITALCRISPTVTNRVLVSGSVPALAFSILYTAFSYNCFSCFTSKTFTCVSYFIIITTASLSNSLNK